MDTKSRITPEADALMQAEPLIQRGLRQCELRAVETPRRLYDKSL